MYLSHKNFLYGKILMTSFHVICGLDLHQSKILGTPMNWRSPKKIFEDVFFFLENTCACVLGPWPWPRAFLSLASRGSVLGKVVLGLGLGLGFFLCPWPRALCPRLHLCFVVGYNSVAKLNFPDKKLPYYTKVVARVGLFKSGSGSGLRLTKFRA